MFNIESSIKTLLLIIVFAISITASSQSAWKTEWLKQDKALHFTTSIMLTSLGTELAKDWKCKNPEVVGITLAISAGLAKEFLYDTKPSTYDLTADIVGCIAGVYVNRMFNKWETNKYFKQKKICAP